MLRKPWSTIHIPKYVQAACLISLGGALFGSKPPILLEKRQYKLTRHSLDTGTIGPITSMAQFATTFGKLSSTVHGLVVSTILIPAAIASFFGGHLADSVGRPRAIAIGACIFGVGGALEAGSVRLAMLIVGRAVKGGGVGLFLSTVVV
jgi:MFS family permease